MAETNIMDSICAGYWYPIGVIYVGIFERKLITIHGSVMNTEGGSRKDRNRSGRKSSMIKKNLSIKSLPNIISNVCNGFVIILMIIEGKSVPNSLHIVNGRVGLMLLIIFRAIINQTTPRIIVEKEMRAVLSSNKVFWLARYSRIDCLLVHIP